MSVPGFRSMRDRSFPSADRRYHEGMHVHAEMWRLKVDDRDHHQHTVPPSLPLLTYLTPDLLPPPFHICPIGFGVPSQPPCSVYQSRLHIFSSYGRKLRPTARRSRQIAERVCSRSTGGNHIFDVCARVGGRAGGTDQTESVSPTWAVVAQRRCLLCLASRLPRHPSVPPDLGA